MTLPRVATPTVRLSSLRDSSRTTPAGPPAPMTTEQKDAAAETAAALRALLDTVDVTSVRDREVTNTWLLFNGLLPNLGHTDRVEAWCRLVGAFLTHATLLNPSTGYGLTSTSDVLHEAGERPTGDSYTDDQAAIQVAETWLDQTIRAIARANTLAGAPAA